MRSKSNDMDSTVNGVLVVPCGPHDIGQDDEGKLHSPDKSKKLKEKQKDEQQDGEKELSGNEKTDERATKNNHQNPGLKDLSKDDLLKLLGIMEGEVQVMSKKIPPCLLFSNLLSIDCCSSVHSETKSYKIPVRYWPW